MKVSFILPTLNEHGNITRLIKKINDITRINNIENEIIVIDDNSIDGTIKDVKNLVKNQKNLKLIVRKDQKGIGSAHIVGYCLSKGDLIISMDADLSHPPEKIPEFISRDDIKYTIAVDEHGINAESFNVFFHPTVVLIDRKGIIKAVNPDETQLKDLLKLLLE